MSPFFVFVFVYRKSLLKIKTLSANFGGMSPSQFLRRGPFISFIFVLVSKLPPPPLSNGLTPMKHCSVMVAQQLYAVIMIMTNWRDRKIILGVPAFSFPYIGADGIMNYRWVNNILVNCHDDVFLSPSRDSHSSICPIYNGIYNGPSLQM